MTHRKPKDLAPVFGPDEMFRFEPMDPPCKEWVRTCSSNGAPRFRVSRSAPRVHD